MKVSREVAVTLTWKGSCTVGTIENDIGLETQFFSPERPQQARGAVDLIGLCLIDFIYLVLEELTRS